jgi:DNA-binding CsgD family transcriptional regulator
LRSPERAQCREKREDVRVIPRDEVHAFLSHAETVELLELIHGTVSCETNDDFLILFTRLQALIPFECAIAVLGSMERNGSSRIVQAVNVSYPEEWVRTYIDKNFAPRDVVVQEHFNTFRPFCWEDAYARRKQSPEILSMTRDMRISKGYTHGVQTSVGTGSGSLFSFCGESMPREERINRILEYAVPHLHQAFLRVLHASGPTHRAAVLSAREQEVLEWLKYGKTSWDISVILGISERTVNFHVYNVMNKLGASNRTQIVSIALHLGLIKLD